MKNLFKVFAVIAFIISSGLMARANDGRYVFTVDLTKVVDDKVFVSLSTPSIEENEILYYLPKIIPGTYAIADYGRYVSDFKAYDKKGNSIPVENIDENTWKISKAKKLYRITYWVEDTFDSEIEGAEIFQPAGTNIEDDKNFIINSSGFFGYFKGMKDMEFTFNIIRPDDFFGGTGLIPVQDVNNLGVKFSKETQELIKNKSVDTYSVENYDRLIDSPLMYSRPDSAIIRVANTEVLIASYSPSGMVSAKQIASTIRETLMAQKEFLGGKLPVDKYAFIFYFTDQPVYSYGALEHSYSSFYYMPEMTIEQMEQQLRDFAAHEFFHIVTPLTIHSEEIHSFDFNDPKMSKHLWLYEGVTEYFAGNVQVKYGLISPEEYLQTMQHKLVYSKTNFNDSLAFTDLSKYTLETYSDQYVNVYQKGALIGFCLDILLVEGSNGEYNLRDMVMDLSKRYGKDKAFNDDELFDVIEEITNPTIREFFAKYVEGNEMIPYSE
ncbi:MAG: peptidase M61, partial [Cyclobacteriaceae bacterium]|nr:peptidase M61 [Cyclobacteriaceae bacterium]